MKGNLVEKEEADSKLASQVSAGGGGGRGRCQPVRRGRNEVT